MTKQELNRDIKRLWKKYKSCKGGNTTNWTNADWNTHTVQQREISAEVKRLYYADPSFESLTKQSILYLMAVNSTIRAIEPHRFIAITIK